MKLIIGGGLAGLIAAHAWPQATVVEAAPQPTEAHKALLRFRSDAVSKLTGIEFRKVRVHKGIFSEGRFVAPNIRVANLYAQKVLGDGRLSGDRSIWSLDPVERFIAPETLYQQLVDSVGNRLVWGQPMDFNRIGQPVVNTAPLPVVLSSLEAGFSVPPSPTPEFRRAGIKVKRWRLPGADIFQTVYFPDHDTTLYRASITKDLLIAEFAGDTDPNADYDQWIGVLEAAFGIDLMDSECMEDVHQRYGKIEPISEVDRKRILFWLTHEHQIYSLGRFATWRNVLLDDVVDDIAVIKRIARNSAAYDLRKAAT